MFCLKLNVIAYSFQLYVKDPSSYDVAAYRISLLDTTYPQFFVSFYLPTS